ncbi:uncharacterized protein METZ01_LOCUS443589 [marine metagenome]|uniref:Uncharacterized protein n=1 Tax=marine metagenome TaxID=408172 RepID=A0A382Z6L3_9ZZZZ
MAVSGCHDSDAVLPRWQGHSAGMVNSSLLMGLLGARSLRKPIGMPMVASQPLVFVLEFHIRSRALLHQLGWNITCSAAFELNACPKRCTGAMVRPYN